MIMRRVAGKLGILLVVSLCALPAASSLRAAELPGRISDEAFWQMVSDFSEPSGYFRFENFLSNELAYQAVIPSLQEKAKPGGVYLGVGPEQNFTYLVALEPKIAFIVDIRRQNMLEHLMYKALFELSHDRAEFLSLLYSRPQPSYLKSDATSDALFDAYWDVPFSTGRSDQTLQDIMEVLLEQHKFPLSLEDQATIGYVYKVFTENGPTLDFSLGGLGGTPGTPTYADLMVAKDGNGRERSYLATEENFRLVREMHRKNLIVPLVGDFGGPKALKAVAQYLKEHDATVTAFYTSNVEQYLFQSAASWRRFYTNVSELPLDDSSTFIRSVNGAAQLRSRRTRNRFDSVLSSMTETVKAFQDGAIRYYFDIIEMSY
jgi:hypothetical protein